MAVCEQRDVRLRQVDLLSRTVTRGGAVATMIKINAAGYAQRQAFEECS
jgi:hypothetical protein